MRPHLAHIKYILYFGNRFAVFIGYNRYSRVVIAVAVIGYNRLFKPLVLRVHLPYCYVFFHIPRVIRVSRLGIRHIAAVCQLIFGAVPHFLHHCVKVKMHAVLIRHNKRKKGYVSVLFKLIEKRGCFLVGVGLIAAACYNCFNILGGQHCGNGIAVGHNPLGIHIFKV